MMPARLSAVDATTATVANMTASIRLPLTIDSSFPVVDYADLRCRLFAGSLVTVSFRLLAFLQRD
jgi:hypothetical protein